MDSNIRTWILLLCCSILLSPMGFASENDVTMTERLAMVRAIESDVAHTSDYLKKSELNPAVMQVMRELPRHVFVPPAWRDLAYENRPLPIGHGQTISQPYIVALMTDLIEPKPDFVVLEIGTGSGYQAAVLSRLVKKVYSIEIIEPLAKSAAQAIQQLAIKNIETRVGDGYYGWESAAPFDAIVVTAAASHVPPPLLRQLKSGGRMIIPIGSRFMTQQLVLVEKDKEGKPSTRPMLPVVFVPLTGAH